MAALMPAAAAPPRAAADTRLLIPGMPAGGLHALHEDRWDTARHNPMVRSLPFIDWEKPAAPALFSGPRYQLQGVLLATLQAKDDSDSRHNFYTKDVIGFEYGDAAASAVAHVLHAAGVFDQVYANRPAFLDAVGAHAGLDLSPVALDPSHFVATEAYAGPVHMDYLHEMSVRDLLDEGKRLAREQPCELLAKIVLCLGPVARDATRQHAQSTASIFAASLAGQVSTWARLPAGASAPVIGSQTAKFLRTAVGQLLTPLRAGGVRPDAHAEDLRDGVILAAGRASEIEATMWERVNAHLDQFTVLGEFEAHLGSSAETKATFIGLMQAFGVARGALDPYQSTILLDKALETHGLRSQIQELFAAGSTVKSVVDLLIDEHRHARGGSVHEPPPAESAGGAGGAAAAGSAGLRETSLSNAFGAKVFREAVEACSDKGGTEFLETCFRSGSMILTRYLTFEPVWLRGRHTFLNMRVARELDHRQLYFARALALDLDTGEVPTAMSAFKWCPVQLNLLLTGRFAEMDMVNSPGGFTAVRALRNGTQYLAAPSNLHYTVESTLVGVRDYFTRLLTALGYPAHASEGHSWADCVDKQISVVQYIDGLPTIERSAWLEWADGNFRTNVLKKAQSEYLNRILSAEPAEEAFDGFLGYIGGREATFFSNIRDRMDAAQPIATVRLAFPSLFTVEPISLLGIQPPQAGGTSSGAPGGGKPPGGGKQPVGGKQPGGGKRKGDGAPAGSKYGIGKVAYMLDSDTLFLGGRVYDVKAAAAELKVDVDACCWPVLFTTKKGNEALEVCCDTAHGDLSQPKHKKPKGFDLTKLSKKYSEQATPEQKKTAGWGVSSKKP